MNYLSNRRLAKVTSHSVCEIRKITEFPALVLVKSCFPPVDTLKHIKRIERMSDNFPSKYLPVQSQQ